MKTYLLADAIGMIDADILEEHLHMRDVLAKRAAYRKTEIIRWLAVAASILLVMTVLLVFSRFAGTKENTEDLVIKGDGPQTEQIEGVGGENAVNGIPGESYEYYFSVTANTWDKFNEKLASAPQTLNTGLLARIVNHTSLEFDSYKLNYLGFNQYANENGGFNGNETLELYWHETKEHSPCQPACCKKICFYWIHITNGVDRESVTRGYTQQADKNLFFKEIGNNKVSYVYLIDDAYYCYFSIEKDNADEKMIAGQLIGFCKDIKDMLNER